MSQHDDAPLVLGSASPRRKMLLEEVRLVFRVEVSDAEDGRRPEEAPGVYVERAAAAKAGQVADRLAGERPAPFVLGADTIVVVDDDVLGKPRDDAEGERMVTRLLGRWHEVITAVVLCRAGEGELDRAVVTTGVRFRDASDAEVKRYVATGEGRDKAGGYAVQGIASGFVRELRGSYANVVGLPVVETLELLRAHGALGEWP